MVYVVLFLFGLVFAVKATDNFDDFTKLLTPYVAAISAMLAAVIAYINVARQTKLSLKVEQLKADLTKDVELVKTSLAAESIAFSELSRAMNAHYFSVAKVEEGQFNATISQACDDAMAAVEYQLMRLSDDCRLAFRTFWQELHVAEQKFAMAASNDERVAYWQTRKKRVNQLQKEFEDAFRAQQSAR
ncbi:hypothetical protein [Paraburkholderia sp.]|uniref:hypothetical protein n=1 Tax=Paraburkholderia sp. TaxID=1926495 RepID=UPI003C736A81